MMLTIEGKELHDVVAQFLAKHFPNHEIQVDDVDGGTPRIHVNHGQYDLPRLEVHLRIKNNEYEDDRFENDIPY